MKQIICFLLFATFHLAGFAQFRVDSIGRMTVRNSVHVPLFGEVVPVDFMHDPSSNRNVGMKVAVCGQAVKPEYSYYYGSCGLKGVGGNGETGYNYGVMGYLAYSAYGAAVYGSVYNSCQPIGGRNAGYFDGNVHITEDLQVGGLMSANTGFFVDLSARNLEIIGQEDDEEMSLDERMSNLSVVTTTREYERTVDVEYDEYGGVTPVKEKEERIHYALEEESVCKMFPELVAEGKDGQKMVNYMELIPLMIKTVNRLSKRVEELENGGAAPKRIATPVPNLDGADSGDAARYDLSGRQLPADAKGGVTIQNGRKYHTL